MITNKERIILTAIRDNEFQDGFRGTDTVNHAIWTDCLNTDPINGHQVSGVISSLAKKKLIGHQEDRDGVRHGRRCSEGTVWLTSAGLTAICSHDNLQLMWNADSSYELCLDCHARIGTLVEV